MFTVMFAREITWLDSTVERNERKQEPRRPRQIYTGSPLEIFKLLRKIFQNVKASLIRSFLSFA
jgi:hypothetical protein